MSDEHRIALRQIATELDRETRTTLTQLLRDLDSKNRSLQEIGRETGISRDPAVRSEIHNVQREIKEMEFAFRKLMAELQEMNSRLRMIR